MFAGKLAETDDQTFNDTISKKIEVIKTEPDRFKMPQPLLKMN